MRKAGVFFGVILAFSGLIFMGSFNGDISLLVTGIILASLGVWLFIFNNKGKHKKAIIELLDFEEDITTKMTELNNCEKFSEVQEWKNKIVDTLKGYRVRVKDARNYIDNTPKANGLETWLEKKISKPQVMITGLAETIESAPIDDLSRKKYLKDITNRIAELRLEKKTKGIEAKELRAGGAKRDSYVLVKNKDEQIDIDKMILSLQRWQQWAKELK
ncbi:MAG TPA: hypothetical protein VMX33_15090 [bacterium]|nr:hypothetical protein [bacterium]